MHNLDCEGELACLWDFAEFEDVPQLVAANFGYSVALRFEEVRKGVFGFVGVDREFDWRIECLYFLRLLLLRFGRLLFRNFLFLG